MTLQRLDCCSRMFGRLLASLTRGAVQGVHPRTPHQEPSRTTYEHPTCTCPVSTGQPYANTRPGLQCIWRSGTEKRENEVQAQGLAQVRCGRECGYKLDLLFLTVVAFASSLKHFLPSCIPPLHRPSRLHSVSPLPLPQFIQSNSWGVTIRISP